MESLFLEKKSIKVLAGPVDFNDAAVTGGRFDMKTCERVTFLLLLAAGTATAAHTFTLRQHDAASAGNSFDLAVANPYFHKVVPATVFTKVVPTVETAAYDLHTLLANGAAIVAFEVLAENLREDCRWVSINATDAGGAQLGTIFAIGESKLAPAYSKAV